MVQGRPRGTPQVSQATVQGSTNVQGRPGGTPLVSQVIVQGSTKIRGRPGGTPQVSKVIVKGYNCTRQARRQSSNKSSDCTRQ